MPVRDFFGAVGDQRGVRNPGIGKTELTGTSAPLAVVPVYKGASTTPIATAFADQAGAWTITLGTATAADDVFRTRDGGVKVFQPLAISGTPPQVTPGQAYSWTPTISGGSGPRTFTLAGTLAAGFSFNSSTGTVSATNPTNATVSGISITVIDPTGFAILAGLTFRAADAAPAGFSQVGRWYLASNRTRSPINSGSPNTAANKYMLSDLYLGDVPNAGNGFGVQLPSHYTTSAQGDNEFSAQATFDIQGVSIGIAPRTSDYSADRAAAVWSRLYYNGVVGQNAVVIDPTTNAVGVLYYADLAIPANSRIWVKTQFHADGVMPYGYEHNLLIGEGQAGSSTDSLGAKLLDGSSTNTSGRIASQLYGPSAAFMRFASTDGRPVVLAIGDSIGYGKNEILTNSGPQITPGAGGVGRGGAGGGFLSRGLNDNVSSLQFLGGNICIPGSGPADVATNGRAKTARKWDAIKQITTLNGSVPPFTHIICEHGNNSLVGTLTDFRDGTMKPYWSLIKAEWPGIPLIQTTLIPKAPTTDGFQTTANQTPNQIDASTGTRFQFNDDLLATKCQGAVDGAINTFQYLSDPTDRGKWAVQPGMATLASALAAGTYTSISVNENVLALGDFVSLDIDTPGSAGAQGAGVSVVGISGSGPYTITFNTGVAIANAQAAGAKVKPHYAADGAGLHPGTTGHVRVIPAITGWKNSIWPGS